MLTIQGVMNVLTGC